VVAQTAGEVANWINHIDVRWPPEHPELPALTDARVRNVRLWRIVDVHTLAVARGGADAIAEQLVGFFEVGMLRGDGRNGFSLPVLELAREQLMVKAWINGIAMLSVHNAHHFSAVWPDIEPFARKGFLAEWRHGRQTASIDLRGMLTLPGAHNHQNACAAYAAAHCPG